MGGYLAILNTETEYCIGVVVLCCRLWEDTCMLSSTRRRNAAWLLLCCMYTEMNGVTWWDGRTPKPPQHIVRRHVVGVFVLCYRMGGYLASLNTQTERRHVVGVFMLCCRMVKHLISLST